MPEHLTVGTKKLEIIRINAAIKNRPTLVFLHEGLGCALAWKDFPQIISDAVKCPAVVYSRFGYGGSDPDPLPWKINFMHTHAKMILPEVLASAGIDDHILIGHSDGGSIALIYAGLYHPKGLRGMVTLAAHVFCEQLSVDSIFQAKVHYETGALKKGLEKYHGRNTENAFRGWNDVWLNPVFMKWNIEKYLPKIDVPLLALQGEDDQYGTYRQLESIKNSVRNVKTDLIKDCRHAPHREQPAVTSGQITRFIKDLTLSGRF